MLMREMLLPESNNTFNGMTILFARSNELGIMSCAKSLIDVAGESNVDEASSSLSVEKVNDKHCSQIARISSCVTSSGGGT